MTPTPTTPEAALAKALDPKDECFRDDMLEVAVTRLAYLRASGWDVVQRAEPVSVDAIAAIVDPEPMYRLTEESRSFGVPAPASDPARVASARRRAKTILRLLAPDTAP